MTFDGDAFTHAIGSNGHSRGGCGARGYGHRRRGKWHQGLFPLDTAQRTVTESISGIVANAIGQQFIEMVTTPGHLASNSAVGGRHLVFVTHQHIDSAARLALRRVILATPIAK